MSDIDENTAGELSLNDDGEIELSDGFLIGTATNVFGDKIYEDVGEIVDDLFSEGELHDDSGDLFYSVEPVLPTPDYGLINQTAKSNVEKLLDTAANHYDKTMTNATRNALDRKLKADVELITKRNNDDYRIELSNLEEKRDDALNKAKTDDDVAKANATFIEKAKKLQDDCKESLKQDLDKAFSNSQKEIVKAVETDAKEKEKREKEESIREHLRGFSRTIPSFLMA